MTLDVGPRVRQAPALMARGTSRLAILLVSLLLLLPACNATEQVTTKLAPDFAPGRHAVSVFGLYKDGRMSSEDWSVFGPQMTRALAGGTCEAAYGGALLSHDPTLSTAIDEYTSANGPTDDLLAKLAPAAQGDLILVLTVAGKLPVPIKISVKDPQRGPSGGLYGLRGQKTSGDKNALQMTATLFSVTGLHAVAVVDLQYTGEDSNEALAKFDAQVAQVLSTSSCAGWRADSDLHAEQIRQLGQ